MNKYITIFSAWVLFMMPLWSASQRMEKWYADAYCMNTGEKGTLFFEIHPVANQYTKLDQQAAKMAVFSVLFLGVKPNIQVNCEPVPPMLPGVGVIAANQDFFKSFFAKNGPYLRYVSVVDAPGQFELVKVRGKGWRMGYTVSVYTDMLYADLQKRGIIK